MSSHDSPQEGQAPLELSRRERKKEETRHRIFHAAIDLFREKGFESTTVDEITERADVARGTFFNYFPRKDSVLAYLSESRLQAVEAEAGVLVADRGRARDKLLDLYLGASLPYEEDRELSRYVLLELMSRGFAPSEEMGLRTRWDELILQLVRQGQAKGELRRDTGAERIGALLTGVYYAVLYQWACLPQDVFALQEELRAQLELALDGVTA